MDVTYTMALTGFLDDVNGVYRDPSHSTILMRYQRQLWVYFQTQRVLTPALDPLPTGSARGDGTNDSYLRVELN